MTTPTDNQPKQPGIRLSVSITPEEYARLERYKTAQRLAGKPYKTQDVVSAWITEKLDEARQE